MKILITGAFGNLGLMCLEEALIQGYEVVCFDLDTAHNRKVARKYCDCTTTLLGDIRDSTILDAAVSDVDAIIHNASVLPPTTEDNPSLAREINVVACQRLIDAASLSKNKPKFIFPSSVTVFGLPYDSEPPKHEHDPIEATDNYTRHKVEIEQYLKASNFPWVVLRVGVSVDARTLGTDKKTFISLLSVQATNPMEYVHPKDVALAMCNAVSCDEANNRVLLIGGGKGCQINQHQFLATAFTALGLTLNPNVFGKNRFYTHWMHTEESNRILQFQRYSFSQYATEMNKKMRFIRPPLRFLSFALNPIINGYLRQQVLKNH